MPQYICPICSNPLNEQGRSYRCEEGHNYDIAKSGYVNLLPPSPAGKRHGDDKLMVKARTAFLDKGYYNPLINKIAEIAAKYAPDFASVIDAGCGEGKYTFDVLQAIKNSGKTADICGIDISTAALIQASKRSKDIKFCAASIAKMPFYDNSADILLNIFSPFFDDEYKRVIKKGGFLIRAIPLERHLWELKELIYEKPYENKLPSADIEGFEFLEECDICYSFCLDNSEDIMALFMMTPYYYKTGKEDQKKAENASHLTVSAGFRVAVYKKF